MWEPPTTSSLLGTVDTATSSTVTFQSEPPRVNGTYFLTIIGGKGIGQNYQIKSFDQTTNTYTIEGNWNVMPDPSSIIVASQIVSKAVVYGNSLDGTTEAYNSPKHVASAGIQAYHGSTNLIIAHNTFHELRTGVSLWSATAEDLIKPNYFTQITDNAFTDNLTGISFRRISGQQGTNVLGSIIRDNSLNNVDTGSFIEIRSSSEKILVDGNYFPNVNMNVYEYNTLGNIGKFLEIAQPNDNIHNIIVLENSFI
jgi:hypothetical protein